jgi:hypothetical protein
VQQTAQTSSGAGSASHLKASDGSLPCGEVTISQLRLVPRLRMYETVPPLPPALSPTPMCLHGAHSEHLHMYICSVFG